MTHGRSLLHSESLPAAPPARCALASRAAGRGAPATATPPRPRPAQVQTFCIAAERAGRWGRPAAAGSQIRPGERPSRDQDVLGAEDPRGRGGTCCRGWGVGPRGARRGSGGSRAGGRSRGERGSSSFGGFWSSAGPPSPPVGGFGSPERSALGGEGWGPSTLRVGGPLMLLQVGVSAPPPCAASGERHKSSSQSQYKKMFGGNFTL